MALFLIIQSGSTRGYGVSRRSFYYGGFLNSFSNGVFGKERAKSKAKWGSYLQYPKEGKKGWRLIYVCLLHTPLLLTQSHSFLQVVLGLMLARGNYSWAFYFFGPMRLFLRKFCRYGGEKRGPDGMNTSDEFQIP